MAAVQGRVEPGFQPVRRLFGRLFSSPGRGGGSLVVRRGDEVLVDIWGGVADPESRTPWERDSLALSFSTSKGVATTIIHRLADRGLLSYDEPVAAYWPEFAAGGKARLTVRQLMSHQTGLDNFARHGARRPGRARPPGLRGAAGQGHPAGTARASRPTTASPTAGCSRAWPARSPGRAWTS